ncbi:hypothetical protein [Leptospira sp. 'Mane']|uniref:hypothetical protein n=1 Tax=Leptospira sp. 'Mane' TaxID=3387407 RepID=UPI00398A750B
MSTIPFTNTTEDGQVPGTNPDAVTDYFLISDYNNDKNYWHSKICEAIKFMSGTPTEDFQILYGGLVTNAGSSKINISEGAAIGKDDDGNYRIITIPSLSNVSLPSGWTNDRQIWLIGKYNVKLNSTERQHFNGTTYYYQVLDSYLGEDDSNNLFVDSDPGNTAVKWSSFKMNGTTFSDQRNRSTEWSSADKNGKSIGESFSYGKHPSLCPPSKSFPNICISRLSSSDTKTVTLASADGYAKVVTELRSWAWYYNNSDSITYSGFTPGTTTTIQLDTSGTNNTDVNDPFISDIVGMARYHDSVDFGTALNSTNWTNLDLTANFAGSDVRIIGFNSALRQITLDVNTVGQTTSAGNIKIYPFRIRTAASNYLTTIQIRKLLPETTIASGNTAAVLWPNRMQDHKFLRNPSGVTEGVWTTNAGAQTGNIGSWGLEFGENVTGVAVAASSGTPRTGLTTRSNQYSQYIYMYLGGIE